MFKTIYSDIPKLNFIEMSNFKWIHFFFFVCVCFYQKSNLKWTKCKFFNFVLTN